GLGDGDVLLLGVDDEEGVEPLVEVPDAAEVALELLQLATQVQRLFLGHGVEVAGLAHALVLGHLVHARADRLEVGQHSAEPALVDVRHVALGGERRHGVLRLLLRPDEEDLPAVGDEVAHIRVRLLDALEGLVEIDDVDPVALAEDVALHLRVPAPGLVAEVNPGLQQLLHGHDGHAALLPIGCRHLRCAVRRPWVARRYVIVSVGLPPRMRKPPQSMRAADTLFLRTTRRPRRARLATISNAATESGRRDGNERHAVTVRVHSASPWGAARSEADGTTRRAGAGAEGTSGTV